MRLEVRNLNSIDFCESERSLLFDLQNHLESKEIDNKLNEPPSAQVKSAILDFFEQNSWIRKYVFNSDIPTALNRANYTIDGIKDVPMSADCNHRHRTFVEVCFDNRQAIGTNLLKFQSAIMKFEEKQASRGLPILICADRRSLKEFGWDNSAASSEEYEFALRSPYKNIISRSPILVVIRN